MGSCLASSAHVTRAQYRTISGHLDNRKVANSACKLCTAVLHVLHFLNFEVCCEITDYIIMLSRHQCLQLFY